MKASTQKIAAHIQGLSLLELLIAMTLGLAAVAATGWVYVGTSKTYRIQDNLARMQENARLAFETMGNDLRMIGTTGCMHDTAANALNNPTDFYKDLFGMPLSGLQKDTTAAIGSINKYGDTLTVLRADTSTEYVVTSHNALTSTFTVPNTATLGTLLVATDCLNAQPQASLFQATSTSSNSIVHAATGSPGNSTPNLGVLGASYTFAAGSRIYPLSSNTYYVAPNATGALSLYREQPTGTNATLTPEELIEGVDDMHITYGVDTTATADGVVDFVDPDGDGDPYLTISQIAANVPGANSSQQWGRIVSVRISLLMRSNDDNVVSSSQTYTFNGASVTATDRRLRKVFTRVVKLRNR